MLKKLSFCCRLATPARVFLLVIFIVLSNVRCCYSKEMYTADSLVSLQKALLNNEHPDNKGFYLFADKCLAARNADVLISTYKSLLAANKKKHEVRDLQFLYALHEAMDTTKATETNFFICYYIARINTIFHIGRETPLAYCVQATRIAQKMDDNCLIVKGYYLTSSYYNNIKHDLMACYMIYEKLDSFQKANHIDAFSACGVDVNIAYSIIYLYLGDNEKAAEYISKSIRLTPWSTNNLKLFDLYTRRAGFEIETDKPGRAFLSLDSAAMVIRTTPNNRSSINDMYSIRFSCYVKQQDYVNAARLLDSVDVHKLSVSNDEFYDYLYALMLFNIHNGDYEKVKENIKLYIPDLKEWNILRWKNVYDAEYRLYAATGDKTKALESFVQYSRYKDSMFHRSQNYAVLAEQLKFQTVKKEQELNLEISLLQKQGQLRQLYLLITVVTLVMTLIIVLQVYRSSEKRKKNIELLTELNNKVTGQKLELEKKNREKDRILDVVAHDLRSPVGGVATLAGTMVPAEMTAESIDRSIKIIRKASGSALELINELLEYSNDTRQEIEKTKEDIATIAEETIALLQVNADAKKQTIVLEVPERPIVMLLDKERIERALANLISNAIKFSYVGSSIQVFVLKGNAYMQIIIKDEGIGVPAKYQLEIFDMFTALNRRGTGGERSFGLGLSITRQIVEAHDGRIWLESEEGKGSAFFIELPLS